MGYTHYWRRNQTPEPPDAFGKLAIDTLKIIDACEARGIKFGDIGGEKPFDRGRDFTEGRMEWNGFGEDGYESVWWPAEEPDGFVFCKTAQEPYDIAVCAMLIRAKVHYGTTVKISSDGDWDSEWKDAAQLCTELFGEAINPMDER